MLHQSSFSLTISTIAMQCNNTSAISISLRPNAASETSGHVVQNWSDEMLWNEGLTSNLEDHFDEKANGKVMGESKGMREAICKNRTLFLRFEFPRV